MNEERAVKVTMLDGLVLHFPSIGATAKYFGESQQWMKNYVDHKIGSYKHKVKMFEDDPDPELKCNSLF